jgi:hypothetical protein
MMLMEQISPLMGRRGLKGQRPLLKSKKVIGDKNKEIQHII